MFIFYIFLFIAFIYFILFCHHLIFSFRFRFDESALLMFFGLPGSGKSTVCAEIVRQIFTAKKNSILNRIAVFCNFPVRGSNRLDRSMIGNYDFRGSKDYALLLLDEASTIYFKRNAMQKDKNGKLQFSDAENRFHSMHRHYKTMEVCFAQSWDGVDIRLRELSTGLFYVEKSRIPGFIKIRRIGKIFAINEDHQPIDGYDFVKWSSRYVLARRAWKLFDTYDAPEMPSLIPEPWYSESGEA